MELSRVFCTEPLAGGEPLTANEAPGIREASLVRRDGRKLPVEVAAVAARDAGGRIIGFVWTFHDIAARRRAEEALREREEHYRSLIERSSEVMALIERDGSIYYVSSAVRHILGFEPTELIGCSALALIHAEDLPSLLRDPNAAGPPVRIRVRHAAGGWRTLELHLAERPERAAARFLVRASDVTEQVAAEERLARETEVAAALARAGEEMMSAMATEDLLPRLCRVTAEVLKCDFSHTWLWRPAEKEFVMVAGHGDSAEDRATLRALRVPQALLAGLLARLRTEDPVVGSMDDAMPPLPAALPRRYGIEHALYATLERGGELVGIQTAGFRRKGVHFSPVQRRIARDLARLASIALEHQRVVEELRQTSRLKSDLMDMLSHELRAPLGTLAGITALFREGAFGALTETQAERFADVDRMLREMLDLIQSTLDLSRLERHEAPLDLRTVSAESLVDGLAASRPKAGDVELAIHVPADLPPIETDPLKLRVVIENLVTNALKFTRHGSVSLMARAESGGLLFEVADTGVGIPEGKRELVFEPFRQLATSDAQQGGVGLGLYIVRRLVEMLGGRIEMESTVGVGTTFRVWIPLAPTKGRDDGLAANAPDSRLQ
jgi:PAS domain S-box-containing protein